MSKRNSSSDSGVVTTELANLRTTAAGILQSNEPAPKYIIVQKPDGSCNVIPWYVLDELLRPLLSWQSNSEDSMDAAIVASATQENPDEAE